MRVLETTELAVRTAALGSSWLSGRRVRKQGSIDVKRNDRA